MQPYYADAQKHLPQAKGHIDYDVEDKAANQLVTVFQSNFGVTVNPGRRWSPRCQKLFIKEKANGVSLDSFYQGWDGDLSFLKDLPQCKRLRLAFHKPLEWSAIVANPNLDDLQLHYLNTDDPGELDLTSLPRLRMCKLPVYRGFMSILKCPQLRSLWLYGGRHEGIISLEGLPALEELICSHVRKLKGVRLNSKAQLRSLELSYLKLFESIEPLRSVVQELLVVELQKAPLMPFEWLANARKLECISLSIKVPSIKFLKPLKKLQVIDLFGGKVLDQDFSLRDALPQQLDDRLWGTR